MRTNKDGLRERFARLQKIHRSDALNETQNHSNLFVFIRVDLCSFVVQLKRSGSGNSAFSLRDFRTVHPSVPQSLPDCDGKGGRHTNENAKRTRNLRKP